jgi:succinyl-CoA synthetase beta subunit
LIDPLIRITTELYHLYWDMDGDLIEINPLVITREGKPVAADAKFNIDNNALYRQPSAPKPEQKSIEARAAAVQLSFVQLDGNIGIISNGAGLTMATMDHIHLEGGDRPIHGLWSTSWSRGKDASTFFWRIKGGILFY